MKETPMDDAVLAKIGDHVRVRSATDGYAYRGKVFVVRDLYYDPQTPVRAALSLLGGGGDCIRHLLDLEVVTKKLHPEDQEKASHETVAVPAEYESLHAVLMQALEQAAEGKGSERHALKGEAFEDQKIVQLGEWMGSPVFAIGQACKKAIESVRLPPERARADLLGAINYLAAAVIQLDRSEAKRG